ncbi:hypothetical protein XENOCAPTIV_028617 [Xenoophorus captivus]|uniref:G-protein coupled receptors family 1 profile domain-containing protein n=1 Tax=Xenoophorus captivus TaxID=1517983 RepID=A0ABV0QPQ5_9TELE
MLAISLFHNDSLLNPNVLPIDPFFCFFTHPGKIIYSTSNFLHAIIMLCPCIFILYLGFQQLQQKSAYSSAATISHFDIFTFHMAGIELIGALGSIVSITAIYVENVNIFSIGLFIFSFTWYGQIFLHTLTCVESYLAVIHPIVYLCLKTEKEIKIRNVCMGCIWLFCFGGMNAVKTGNYIYLDFFLLVSSTIVISFCSVSMLVKNLLSTNDSSLPLHPLPLPSSAFLNLDCLISPQSNFIFAGFFITNSFILLLLCFLTVYNGVCEWKQKGSTLVLKMSHSDFFTYHLVIMELIGAFGCIVCCCGIYSDQFNVILGGTFPWFYSWYGETLFHTMICLERYLAVAYPITYRRLRNERRISTKNISTGFVWLLSFSGICLMFENIFIIMNLCILAIVLAIVSFCSLSALLVLIHPSPGKQLRVGVHHSKKRAFYTIVAILGVLVLRFFAGLAWTVVYKLQVSCGCVIMGSAVWFTMPSSLVLPLLFLHRAGKILCCKKGL